LVKEKCNGQNFSHLLTSIYATIHKEVLALQLFLFKINFVTISAVVGSCHQNTEIMKLNKLFCRHMVANGDWIGQRCLRG